MHVCKMAISWRQVYDLASLVHAPQHKRQFSSTAMRNQKASQNHALTKIPPQTRASYASLVIPVSSFIVPIM